MNTIFLSVLAQNAGQNHNRKGQQKKPFEDMAKF
jgi:hypothetical protein